MLHLIKYPHFGSLQVKLSQRGGPMQMMQFLKDAITNPNFLEYNGYNTRWCRQSEMLPLPKTDVTFLPLIDNPSADPDT